MDTLYEEITYVRSGFKAVASYLSQTYKIETPDKIFISKLDKAIEIFKKEDAFTIKNLKYRYWIYTRNELEDRFNLKYVKGHIEHCGKAVKFEFYTEGKSLYHNDIEKDDVASISLNIYGNNINLFSTEEIFEYKYSKTKSLNFFPNKGPQHFDSLNKKIKTEKYDFKEIINIKNNFVKGIYKLAEKLI